MTQFISADLTIDPISGEICQADQRIRLSANQLKLLLSLIERAEKVVSRSDLFDLVWPRQTVSDDVLTKAVSDLRAQLAHFGSHKYIETIPKAGYRWCFSVQSVIADLSNDSVIPASPQKEDFAITQSESIELPTRSKWTFPLWMSRMIPWLFAAVILAVVAIGFHRAVSPTLDVRLAVLSIDVSQPSLQSLGAELETQLKQEILQTKGIKYLSSKALNSQQGKEFSYFSRQLGVDWIIEGQLQLKDKHPQLTLNLVDARTALVADSITFNFKEDSSGPANRLVSFWSELGISTDG